MLASGPRSLSRIELPAASLPGKPDPGRGRCRSLPRPSCPGRLLDLFSTTSHWAPEFPRGTIPPEVAHEVYRRTGGQPFLLQIFGSLLVGSLNDDGKRKFATLDDVQAVETRAIEWAEPYFREAHRTAPPPAREALARLLQGQTPDLPPIARRWLAQRYLLTPDDRLAVPLFGTWIEHHALV